jgi:hypothetical protein
MYAPISNCSGPPATVGLNGDWDESDVLVCKAHSGRLRKNRRAHPPPRGAPLTEAFSKQKPTARPTQNRPMASCCSWGSFVTPEPAERQQIRVAGEAEVARRLASGTAAEKSPGRA